MIKVITLFFLFTFKDVFAHYKNHHIFNVFTDIGISKLKSKIETSHVKRVVQTSFDVHLCSFEQISGNNGIEFEGKYVKFTGKSKIEIKTNYYLTRASFCSMLTLQIAKTA